MFAFLSKSVFQSHGMMFFVCSCSLWWRRDRRLDPICDGLAGPPPSQAGDRDHPAGDRKRLGEVAQLGRKVPGQAAAKGPAGHCQGRRRGARQVVAQGVQGAELDDCQSLEFVEFFVRVRCWREASRPVTSKGITTSIFVSYQQSNLNILLLQTTYWRRLNFLSPLRLGVISTGINWNSISGSE